MRKTGVGRHKIWRREAKKLRRKRIRQRVARERDKKLEEQENILKMDPVYQEWLKNQEEMTRLEEEQEVRRHDEEEEEWLRRELLAQKRFTDDRKKQAAGVKAKEEQRLRILKEFEEQELQVKKRMEEQNRLMEEARKQQELLLQKIEDYIAGVGELPEELRQTAETNPGKPECPFFIKTASCRFGDKCTRNHIRPGISKILLFRNFFSHIRLEQTRNTEYGTDLVLEYSDSELYKDYCTFFTDVSAELEQFGKIEIFRTCRNSGPHVRGNVLVEYTLERDALKACRSLQGRFYAGKRINVEFCSLQSWKSAICGLSMSGKCPKGRNCNFLHVFRNPGALYTIKMNTSSSRRSEGTSARKIDTWDDTENTSSKRNDWRWSESPEHGRNGDNERTSSTSRNRISDRSSASFRNKDKTSWNHHSRERSRSGHSERSINTSYRNGGRTSRNRLSRERSANVEKPENRRRSRSRSRSSKRNRSRSRSKHRKKSKRDRKKKKRKKHKSRSKSPRKH